MADSIEKLRMAISDESVPDSEHRELAEHLIKLQIAAVDVTGVPDDDPELVKLMTPWANKVLAAMAEVATEGRSVDGWSLKDARAEVLRCHKLRTLLAIICDGAAHHFERIAACTVILDDFLHPRGHHRTNNYTPEKLLSEVLPASAEKWTSTGKFIVERPPQSCADVWLM